jgi:tetratricopeptide (TPR) repeat protein
VGEARVQYERAQATFPDHPLAVAGLARIKIVDGDLAAARLMLQSELAKTPTPDLAIAVGDLSSALGDHAGAEQYFRMAEQIERAAWSNGPAQPQVLARFLADHDRNIAEAVTLAEQAVAARRDIFTMDTLAWAHFKAGHLDQAQQGAAAALRTGTRDARILYHAAAIETAMNQVNAARELLGRIPSLDGIGDVRLKRDVLALQRKLAEAGAL